MLPLKADDALIADKMYAAFFVLKDNGPRDKDAARGGLAGQVVLLTDGPLPGNSGTTRYVLGPVATNAAKAQL